MIPKKFKHLPILSKSTNEAKPYEIAKISYNTSAPGCGGYDITRLLFVDGIGSKRYGLSRPALIAYETTKDFGRNHYKDDVVMLDLCRIKKYKPITLNK